MAGSHSEYEQTFAAATGQAVYEVVVPPGVAEGETFRADVGGVLMCVTVPPGVSEGGAVQVVMPGPPTVQGVPWPSGPANAAPGLVAPGLMHMHPGGLPAGAPVEGYVEVHEISPAGWMCLIVGCFACPGFNLLGLCMRERRLVPASHVMP